MHSTVLDTRHSDFIHSVGLLTWDLLDLQTMQTNADGVFAGGDVVTFPLSARSNKKVNNAHWQMAHVHGKPRLFCDLTHAHPRHFLCPESGLSVFVSPTGRVAALNMMGTTTEIKTVPYFWTAMFGKSIRYAGKKNPLTF